MYYLVRTSKRNKRAKRHIVIKGSIEYIKDFVTRSNYVSDARYKVEIYSGNWQLIESL